MSPQETYRPAFTDPPGTNLAGIPISELKLPNPYISYGIPYDEACAKHLQETFHASRVYIVASRSLASNTDKLDRLVSAIGEEKVVGVRRKGITPHTPWSEVLQISADCRAAKADCVVTLGAGSITDGCKLVVLCLANGIREPEQLARYSVESTDVPGAIAEPTVPLITIPTSLSGGEYFSLAGGTEDSTHHKHGFLRSGMGAKLIILDPDLCKTTPEYHWLSTGIRSVDHCVEALCSLNGTPKSDAKAEEGLRLLVPGLLGCKADPDDVEARRRCQLAISLGMGTIRAGVPMGGSHAIGHQLGPLGVAHGVTSCIMCPAVMKYNLQHGTDRPEIAEKQKRVQAVLWSEPEVAKVLEAAKLARDKADLGDLLDAIIRALGLPRTLKEVGVAPDVIPALSKRALDDFWAPTNPVPLLKAEQMQVILEATA
ncbi:hypothetical protein B0A55_03538 [Friedmanniomyces simplex]|uniref:Uncharacterized protein n=1 Tax=Friedmanniomyces simplex TaxID=329884 RepID=A0A4U0XF79_9PEZI|nr:hypothetical protein B0A55_03538 [Friedmanniomyces simplex]